MKYTVLLLYPDHINIRTWGADEFGRETYLAHVDAKTPSIAVTQAQEEARLYNDTVGYECEVCKSRHDFRPLLVVHGWHEDVNPL